MRIKSSGLRESLPALSFSLSSISLFCRLVTSKSSGLTSSMWSRPRGSSRSSAFSLSRAIHITRYDGTRVIRALASTSWYVRIRVNESRQYSAASRILETIFAASAKIPTAFPSRRSPLLLPPASMCSYSRVQHKLLYPSNKVKTSSATWR